MPAERPLVSIVVTCYNRVHRIPETLETVFAQRYAPVEVVAIDDGSTDGTRELLESYGDRVRVVSQPNSGVAVARNTGVREARGAWIAFQDDDDLMPPDRIVRLMDAIDRFPGAIVACGDWQRIDTDSAPIPDGRSRFQVPHDGGPTLVGDAYRALLTWKLVITPHTCVFRRKNALQVGAFDTRFYKAHEDVDFFSRLARVGPVVYVPEVVSLYRDEPNSASERTPDFHFGSLLLFEKHLRENPSMDPALRARLQKYVLNRLRSLAHHESLGQPLPPTVPRARLDELERLLRPAQRARLAWYRNAGLPLRKAGKAVLAGLGVER